MPLDEASRRLLFTEARTAKNFDPEPVAETTLREIWDLARWPPTSVNTNPLRVLYVRGEAAKKRLLPYMAKNNRPSTESAPVSAIMSVDMAFYNYMPKLVPDRPHLRKILADEARSESTARFSGTLQIGYFLLAVRAVGLAAGPLGGFDHEGVDAEFFADSTWRSLLVINIGKPGPDAWRERGSRLDYEEAVRFA
ncbi:malonic semialdehyde reductase [Frankia sp. CcI49]|uniref:malonic semialdehyde reductase n=1 Tax=Frankia sp. CcI49 TaxID=1745382 RepID=UPI001F51AEC2|nr:malonic semialdehyde reductase [Frankia sp. CcI49]